MGAEFWDQGGGPCEKKDTHTNRFSNRHIPQVIDLELLYQLILRRWEFHCGGKKKRINHSGRSCSLPVPTTRV